MGDRLVTILRVTTQAVARPHLGRASAAGSAIVHHRRFPVAHQATIYSSLRNTRAHP